MTALLRPTAGRGPSGGERTLRIQRVNRLIPNYGQPCARDASGAADAGAVFPSVVGSGRAPLQHFGPAGAAAADRTRLDFRSRTGHFIPAMTAAAARFAVAPMMDWTDRHCRFFHRQLTRRALLYTEMITAEAIIHGDRARLLGFSGEEQPLALQLGGSDPARLAKAAAIAA